MDHINIPSLKELRNYDTKKLESLMKQYKMPIGYAKGDKNQLINRIINMAEFLHIEIDKSIPGEELTIKVVDIFSIETDDY